MSLPSRTVVACDATYNEGGLGKLLAAQVEAARDAGTLHCYFARAARPGDAAGRALPLPALRRLLRSPLLRPAPGWRAFASAELFDRTVAGALPEADVFIGITGQALHSFRAARRRGSGRLVLISPNAHVDNVARQHRRAWQAHHLEPGWLTTAQRAKTRREYALADEIWVLSAYTHQSFVAAGVGAGRLRRVALPLLPRFTPPRHAPPRAGFNILYVGRLEATKGIAVLLDAFRRLAAPDAHLTLIGGFATAAMRRHVERAAADDPRIALAGGDPLPHLHRADVFVHPSYEDGLGLAPLEALACGVPVIVTADTGMGEHVVDGVNGFVVPTGDAGAILDRLHALRARPLRAAAPLLPAPPRTQAAG
jgi:glycosyltransferase involved in cell wall biosynthesis